MSFNFSGNKMVSNLKVLLCALLISAQMTFAGLVCAGNPYRIAIISSYHPEFLWESETNQGVIDALMEAGYLTSQTEADRFTQEEYFKNDKVILQKWWMDTKRKNSLPEIQKEMTRVITDLELFEPDLVITGDDNATNYIGNYYIDSSTPVVFYGVNGNPMKYGLLDSLEHPGRNITGVYQADYLKECVEFLVSLLPEIKTITILSDDSVSSRAKLKKIWRLGETGQLPVQVIGTIATNNYEEWQQQAIDAAKYTDAFFMLNHNTLKNEAGNPVDNLKIGSWYLQNINKPEISYENHFIVEGMLAAVSDSGVKQGYMATQLGIKILEGDDPNTLQVIAPKRGDYVVNLKRAKMLGVYEKISTNQNIEAWVNESSALNKYPLIH